LVGTPVGSSGIVDEDTDDIIATPPIPASAASSLGEDEHPPWPYLAKMFAFVGIKESSYKMKCPVSAEEYGNIYYNC